jgi:hypothetical protein
VLNLDRLLRDRRRTRTRLHSVPSVPLVPRLGLSLGRRRSGCRQRRRRLLLLLLLCFLLRYHRGRIVSGWCSKREECLQGLHEACLGKSRFCQRQHGRKATHDVAATILQNVNLLPIPASSIPSKCSPPVGTPAPCARFFCDHAGGAGAFSAQPIEFKLPRTRGSPVISARCFSTARSVRWKCGSASRPTSSSRGNSMTANDDGPVRGPAAAESSPAPGPPPCPSPAWDTCPRTWIFSLPSRFSATALPDSVSPDGLGDPSARVAEAGRQNSSNSRCQGTPLTRRSTFLTTQTDQAVSRRQPSRQPSRYCIDTRIVTGVVTKGLHSCLRTYHCDPGAALLTAGKNMQALPSPSLQRNQATHNVYPAKQGM